MKPAYMVCYYSAVLGDCVVLKNGIAQDGKLIRAKALPIPYADFARRVMRSKAWQLIYASPGSFHFARKP